MIKIGLFGIGLDTYWPQFNGLLDNLKEYQKQIKSKIEGFGVEVVDAGMVDNPAKANEAAIFLKSKDVEIVFLYVSTYALSSTVLPIAQKLKLPILILNLQPVAQMDYEAFNALADRGKMTGIWLEHCQACGPGGLRECSDEAVDIHATGPVDSDDVHVATRGADVIGDGEDRAVCDG